MASQDPFCHTAMIHCGFFCPSYNSNMVRSICRDRSGPCGCSPRLRESTSTRTRTATGRATVCFYGTGIAEGRLGLDRDAGSLGRAREIRGKLLMVFGSQDPHVPADSREAIDRKLREAGVDYSIKLYPCEHAFMRDEGPRYDPEATDQAFADMIALFREVFR
jgi:dienelactone hydrolase